jgi:hypothetical protein
MKYLIPALFFFSSIVNAKEIICEIENRFEWRDGDKLIAYQSQKENASFNKSNEQFEKTFHLDLDPKSFVINQALDGLSLQDTQEVFNGLMPSLPKPKKGTSIVMGAPSKGFLGLFKTGSWKKGEIAGYSLSTTPKSDSSGGMGEIYQASWGMAGNTKKAESTVYNVQLGNCYKPEACVKPVTGENAFGPFYYSNSITKYSNLTLKNTLAYNCLSSKSAKVNDSERNSIKDVSSSKEKPLRQNPASATQQ